MASLRTTPAQFAFPILVHLSFDGVYKFLREVTLLWDPGDPKLNLPAHFVLATPDCLPAVCDALEAGSIQDGQPFARRMSTAAFSFNEDLTLSGGFGTTLTGQTTLAPDDPLNPFRHLYHPDHDCDQLGECYEITRSFVFTFDTDPPPELARPSWGDSFLTGAYTESLEGLHKNPIPVAGRFQLQRVSTIATLNGQ